MRVYVRVPVITLSLSVCVCQANKQRFLKTFIRDVRKHDKASETKVLNMMNEVNKISRVKIKRSAGENPCRNSTEPYYINVLTSLKESPLLTMTAFN